MRNSRTLRYAYLQETLGPRWGLPTVLGIAADHTQHLLWRLADGELSATMAADPQLVYVVQIGEQALTLTLTLTLSPTLTPTRSSYTSYRLVRKP